MSHSLAGPTAPMMVGALMGHALVLLIARAILGQLVSASTADSNAAVLQWNGDDNVFVQADSWDNNCGTPHRDPGH